MPQFAVLSYVAGVIRVMINGSKYDYRISYPLYIKIKNMPQKASGQAIQLLKTNGEYLGKVQSPKNWLEKSQPKIDDQKTLFDQ